MIRTHTLARCKRSARSMAAAAALIGAGAVPALAQNWEGSHQVRFGAYLLDSTSHITGTINPGAINEATESGSLSSVGGGISAGIEWIRAERFTMGVEYDLGITGNNKTLVGAKFGTDYFTSLRGRAGFYVHPDWVIYGTGGIGFQGVSIDPDTATKASKTLVGGVFGGGTEFHRGGTILFAEYLHGEYGAKNASTIDPLGNITNYRVDTRTDQFRVGVKFKVGYDGYYDAVRDNPRR